MASAQGCFDRNAWFSRLYKPPNGIFLHWRASAYLQHVMWFQAVPAQSSLYGTKASGYSGVSLGSPILPFYSSLESGLTGSPSAWKPCCQLLGAAAAFRCRHSWAPHGVQEPLGSFRLRPYHFTLDVPCCYSYTVHSFSSKTQFRLNFFCRGFFI